MTHEFSVLTRQGRDAAKAREMWGTAIGNESHLVMKAVVACAEGSVTHGDRTESIGEGSVLLASAG